MSASSRIKVNVDAFKKSIIIFRFKQGDMIFNQGDAGNEMFVVRRGRVEILLDQKVLDTVEEEETFGELALIDQRPRSAAARALTDCELVPIDAKRFLTLVQQAPDFALLMLKVLTARLRNMDNHFADLAKPAAKAKKSTARARK